ncbi:MAG: 4,5-DOPA dioxygenase extradiol [Chitinophagales bacterium]|nr:4,5-DOPA dioxygenase extradiol [Chitinophagales bacterium]MDW8427322.1 4,5-DOPA dioxygenase extradiol [Chitinophagales bacterium]
MKRRFFIRKIAGMAATLSSLKAFADALPQHDRPMPVLFIGHGSPMNGIELTPFAQQWIALGKEIPRPEAVVCISAHWLTNGTWVTAMKQPRTIHDFYGFPEELYQVQYPAPGNEALARDICSLITKTQVGLNHDWGLDHGTWTVVRRMYPDADIPVLQVSIDFDRPPSFHYELGRQLNELRRRRVLVIGSGNMVHNLRLLSWQKHPDESFGYDWALEANELFKKLIASRNHKQLISYEQLGAAVRKAVPTPDHFYPLLYVLGMQEDKEEVRFFNDQSVMGSVTMTSVLISYS